MGRLRATVDLMYPTGASLKTVLAAGGMSKLTIVQRERVKFKHVKAGSYCDDLPAVSKARLLANGCVTEAGKPSPRKVTAKKTVVVKTGGRKK